MDIKHIGKHKHLALLALVLSFAMMNGAGLIAFAQDAAETGSVEGGWSESDGEDSSADTWSGDEDSADIEADQAESASSDSSAGGSASPRTETSATSADFTDNDRDVSDSDALISGQDAEDGAIDSQMNASAAGGQGFWDIEWSDDIESDPSGSDSDVQSGYDGYQTRT